MKNRYLMFAHLVAVLVCLATSNFAQPAVCSTDITLTTQAEVDRFPATYGCTEIAGGLTISGDDITNLDSLYAIRSTGTLHIYSNDVLTNVDGLSNLVTVRENCMSCTSAIFGLIIQNNPALTNLHGLSSLSRVEGNIYISGNHELVDLEGLENVTFIGASVDINENSKLINLRGLPAIPSFGSLFISGNNALTNLDGLSNLTTVENNCLCLMSGLIIEDNPVLTNLQGLSSLSRVEGNLKISGNNQLTDLNGFENLTYIGEMLDISNNANLTSIAALSAVTSIGAWLLASQSVQIINNPSLTKIDILNTPTSLPGDLRIQNNASLTDVDGFSSVTKIYGERASVSITDNPLLNNINGFAELDTIFGGRRGGFITVSNNASLKNLNGLSSLTCIIPGISGGLVISNNQTLTEVDGLSKFLRIESGGSYYLNVKDNPMLDRGCGLYPLLHNNGVGGGFCESSTCPAITISGNGPNFTREQILNGGPCAPVGGPADKIVVAENTSGCGSLSTTIMIKDPETNVVYTLRDNKNNNVVAGPSSGSAGLPTGKVTATTTFNVLARNILTGEESVMTTMPVITINPLPQDHRVVAQSDSIAKGTSTNITVPEGESNIMYVLRRDEDNSIVAGPMKGPAILPTGNIFETTTFHVLAVCKKECEKILSTKVTVRVIVPPVVATTAAGMSFFPNPSNGEFQIRFPSNLGGEYHLSLHDLTGSLVKKKSIEAPDELHAAQVDLKPLPPGTYLVSITGPDGIYLRRKVVISE